MNLPHLYFNCPKIRKRYNDRKKHKHDKINDSSKLSYNIMKSFKPKSPVPHVLLELTKRQHSRLIDNCIHLQGISIESAKDNITFDNVDYGKNIKTKKSQLECEDIKSPLYQVMLNRTKRSLFLITALKSECMNVLPQLLTSSTTCINKVVSSGIVVLFACIDRPIEEPNMEWCNEDFKRLKKCKPNILQSSGHHQSSGYYASFGNKGSFDKTNELTVGQYCNKKNSSLLKQISTNKDTLEYEQ